MDALTGSRAQGVGRNMHKRLQLKGREEERKAGCFVSRSRRHKTNW